MTIRSYSLRNNPRSLTLEELYSKLTNLYLMFRDKDYFRAAGITEDMVPARVKYEAAYDLTFQPFPIEHWSSKEITEDHIFEALEFLYACIAKPGPMIEDFISYHYNTYDEAAGREEFRAKANQSLIQYKSGFELTKDGTILAAGGKGLQHILDASIVPYDEINVDSKVRNAIAKWRNRHSSLAEKKEAIRGLADVFEWLKKTKNLSSALDSKDESAIFDIANNFAIRHHNPKQKTNYDRLIWYAWIFHFYLATYHAAVRLLIKKEQAASGGE